MVVSKIKFMSDVEDVSLENVYIRSKNGRKKFVYFVCIIVKKKLSDCEGSVYCEVLSEQYVCEGKLVDFDFEFSIKVFSQVLNEDLDFEDMLNLEQKYRYINIYKIDVFFKRKSFFVVFLGEDLKSYILGSEIDRIFFLELILV